jgi:hypothetical protein
MVFPAPSVLVTSRAAAVLVIRRAMAERGVVIVRRVMRGALGAVVVAMLIRVVRAASAVRS